MHVVGIQLLNFQREEDEKKYSPSYCCNHGSQHPFLFRTSAVSAIPAELDGNADN